MSGEQADGPPVQRVKRKQGEMTTLVRDFLDSRSGNFTYGQIAKAMGSNGKAIGQCMMSLELKGRKDLCKRVKFQKKKSKKKKKI